MIRLTKQQVLLLHQQLIAVSGSSDGLRDEALLDSALHAPFQTYEEQAAFPSIQQKAARLGYGLIMNHPFVDGNKRIGAHVMLTFLALNHVELEYTQQELIDIVLSVAASASSYEDLLDWVLKHEG